MINETLFHAEQGTFRAVTGGAYNMPNAYGEIEIGSAFPSTGTIPKSVIKQGTYNTTGKGVRGTGCKFTELLEGSYLWNGSVLRAIDHIVDDNLMFLKQAFPSDVSSNLQVRVCEGQFYKMIYVKNTHTSNSSTINEAPFRAQDAFVNGGAPLSYDALTGELSFMVSQ
jgi:hypothetical protein